MPIAEHALKVLNRLLPAKPVIIEVGAHHGDAILQYLKIRPMSFITAYEPSSEFGVLLERIGKKAILKPLAVVGNKHGNDDTFYESSSSNRCNTFFKDVMVYKDKHGFGATSVNTVSIREIIDNHVDFVRFDCYGAEYKIFESEGSWLKLVPLLMVSFHVKPHPFDTITYKIKRKQIYELLNRTHRCIWKAGGKGKHKIQIWEMS